MEKKKVIIYSDGAAKSNPVGAGGYGTLIHYLSNEGEVERTEEFTEGFDMTSNNRMELMGVIRGLEELKEPCVVVVVSDSAYVVNAFNNKWIDTWKSNGWKTSDKSPVKNKDLWDRLLSAISHHDVTFKWVKGHNGQPENERCDLLANWSALKVPIKKGEDGIYVQVAEEDFMNPPIEPEIGEDIDDEDDDVFDYYDDEEEIEELEDDEEEDSDEYEL